MTSSVGTPLLFQSTHPHGVRPNGNQEITGPVLFQSTHPHGVRPERSDKGQGRPGVSIHAPTRGATQHKQRLGGNTEFQSTHPHGVRPGCRKALFLPVSRFNPRTHTGCDSGVIMLYDLHNVSIHAPTRGATQCDCLADLHRRVSIHAPTRGATCLWPVSYAV